MYSPLQALKIIGQRILPNATTQVIVRLVTRTLFLEKSYFGTRNPHAADVFEEGRNTPSRVRTYVRSEGRTLKCERKEKKLTLQAN